MCALSRRRENKSIVKQKKSKMIQRTLLRMTLLQQIFNTSYLD